MLHSFKNLLRTLLFSIAILNMGFAQTNLQSKSTAFKEITGVITNLDFPLANVNITIKNTTKGIKTDENGYYSIDAKEGDVLKFSYVGMKPLEVIVGDITKLLNINMRTIDNKLKEVVIDRVVRMPTFYGEINPYKGSISYVKGEDLILGSPDLLTAISLRVPSLRQYNSITLSNNILWDIDGNLFSNNPPIIDVSQVVDVAVLRSLADLTFYGGRGRNGVIVVRTKNAYFDFTNPYSRHNPYTNKVLYKNDAITLTKRDYRKSKYLSALETTTTSFEAFKHYRKQLDNNKDQIDYFFDFSNYFRIIHSDSSLSQKILAEAEAIFSKNPETLKALAYTYQELGLNAKALNIYKNIIRLRPKHAQSFRDLANAFANNKDYRTAWKMYMNYLYRGNALEEKGIGITIYNEMESLFTQKKDVSKIKESFMSKDYNGIEKDIRIVFEWNTSEAEFIFEFVNPQKQSYSFEHTYYENKDLIVDEKKKGYASIEFFIENLTKGDWLTNITYLGNKTNDPTYLKTTVYYNWGQSNQRKEIKVLKLVDIDQKLQLVKLNTKQAPYLSGR